MNIDLAILTFDFAPTIGGVQTYLFEIAQRLGQKCDVCVISPTSGPLEPAPFFERYCVTSRRAFDFGQALWFYRPKKVLVGHAHPQLLLAANLYSPRNYVAMAYGNDYLAAQSHWHRPIFNRLLGNARPLITISKAHATRLQQLGLSIPEIIYPGTDPLRFCPPNQDALTLPILLTVSRLVPRKGIDTVLRALPQLLRAYPNLQYHIVGEGPDRERLEQLAQEHAITSAVRFLGQIPEAQFPEVYHAADIFVMPTRELSETASVEGFGIVYLEASASGLPVITGRSGGAVEAVRDGETGFIVAPDNPQELAEVIGMLLSDPALRRRTGMAGRKWVETEMNWDRAARQMETALGLDS